MQHEKTVGTTPGELSCMVRAWVQAARERQRRRFAGTALVSNADVGLRKVRSRQFVATDPDGYLLRFARGLSTR